MTFEGLQGWPAAIGMLIGGVLVGLKIYLQFKKDFRTDEGHGAITSGYTGLIESLQKENERLTTKIIDCAELQDDNIRLQEENIRLSAEVEHRDVLMHELQERLDAALDEIPPRKE